MSVRGLTCVVLLSLLLPSAAFAQKKEEVVDPELAEFKATVESLLTNEQREVRRMATLALGSMAEDKKVFKAFKEYVDNPDEDIAKAALVALAMREDKAGFKGIKARLEAAEPADLPMLIGELVRPLDEAIQRKILKDTLKKADLELKKALYLYIASELSDEAYGLIGVKTKKSDQAIALAQVLATYPRPLAVDHVKTLYKSKDATVRLEALKLAEAVKTVDAQNIIAEALSDKDEAVVAAAEASLLRLKHPVVVPILEARVKENPKDFETIDILMGFEVPNLVEVLLPLVERDNPKLDIEDYKRVLKLVAAAKNEASKALLDKKLASTYETDRIAAASALGFTDDTAYAVDLALLLVDGNQEIRLGAAQSLARVGTAAVIQNMVDALNAETVQEVKLTTIRSLGAIGDASAVNHLQLMVISNDVEVKRAALDALAMLKAIESTTAIELIADDPDPEMRWHVAVTLFRIDPIVYGEKLKKSVADAPEAAFFATLESFDDAMKAKLEDEVLRGSRTSLALGLLKEDIALGTAGLERVRKAYDLATDFDVKQPAIEHLARFAQPEDLERFAGLLDHSERRVRLLALTTLLRYEKASTEEFFRAQITSDDPLFKALGIYGVVRYEPVVEK